MNREGEKMFKDKIGHVSALISLIIICLCLTGCFAGDANLTIHEDGRTDVKLKFVAVPMLADKMDELKKDVESGNKGGSVTVTPVTDGNMKGYEIKQSYPSIEALAQSDSNLVKAVQGKNTGIRQKKGWFYDAYSFDLIMEGSGNDMSKDNDEMGQMAQAFLSQVRFDFTVDLPYSADSNNADTASNENKTLYWNLASTLTNGQDKYMSTTFRLWHKEKIIGTAIAGAILLILCLVFLVMGIMARSGDGARQRNFIFAAVWGVLFLVLAAFSAYAIGVRPDFTEADTISKAAVKQSSSGTAEQQAKTDKDEKEKNKKDGQPKADSSLTAVQAVLSEYKILDKAIATSHGHNPDGSLSIIESANGKRMFLIDNKNNQVAFVKLTPAVYNFVENNQAKQNPSPVIFDVTILNDKRDNDKELGIWNERDHTFGIYAQYKFDGNGNVVPGMLTSGAGAKPSHYQAYLNEQKNVDLANLFLTEMQALHVDANRKGLNI